MAKFLIAVTQEDNQKILKEWLEDRHICFVPELDDPVKSSCIILNMEYDLGFIDEPIFNLQSENIKKRKFKEYPVILPSLIRMDLDHFRKITNSYGYIIADQVLRSTAQRCYLRIRSADIPGRYRGEKFLFILPETPIKSAITTAERLRKTIAEKPVVVNGNSIFITASFGVAGFSKDMENLSFLLKKADQALMNAKKKGGNRVEVIY